MTVIEKGKLIFNLDDYEGRKAMSRAVRAVDFVLALHDVANDILRREVRYGDDEVRVAIFEEVQTKFYQILEDRNINLDEDL